MHICLTLQTNRILYVNSNNTQDPMADPGERALAQELRGIGLVAYEVPEWKTKVRSFCFYFIMHGVCAYVCVHSDVFALASWRMRCQSGRPRCVSFVSWLSAVCAVC